MNVVDFKKYKFDDVCFWVDKIQKETGDIIEYIEHIDTKIRVGVIVKSLVHCIDSGLIDNERLDVIVGWLKSRLEAYQQSKTGK